MSNLLDQAIIDAEALKEVAMRNAESAILDKFSGQIKEAVEQILDEEDIPIGDEPVEDLEAGDLKASEESDELEIPLANAAGLKLCPCPEKETIEVTFDLDELERQLDTSALEDSEEVARQIDQEEEPIEGDIQLEAIDINKDILTEIMAETSDQLALDEELLEELMAMLDEDTFIDDPEARAADIEGGALAGSPEKAAYAAPTLEESQNESVELSEDLLGELAESLTVDISPRSERSGWLETPQSVFHLAEEELLAMLQDSKIREDHDAKMKALGKLQESNDRLQTNIEKISSDKKELISIVGKLKNRLNESNLANAKLLYTNKVLMSDSLNERQKNKIAEALSNSENVEEAKVIYETLQSATGSTITNKKPESLSEAMNKTTSTLILSHRKRDRENKTIQNDSSVDRWKILAGLNKK